MTVHESRTVRWRVGLSPPPWNTKPGSTDEQLSVALEFAAVPEARRAAAKALLTPPPPAK